MSGTIKYLFKFEGIDLQRQLEIIILTFWPHVSAWHSNETHVVITFLEEISRTKQIEQIQIVGLLDVGISRNIGLSSHDTVYTFVARLFFSSRTVRTNLILGNHADDVPVKFHWRWNHFCTPVLQFWLPSRSAGKMSYSLANSGHEYPTVWASIGHPWRLNCMAWPILWLSQTISQVPRTKQDIINLNWQWNLL